MEQNLNLAEHSLEARYGKKDDLLNNSRICMLRFYLAETL